MPIPVLITEDHGLMRAGLRALLEGDPDIEVVGEAASAEDLFLMLGQAPPEIVLLDIGLPGMDGIEATQRIKERFPEIQVLILTVYEEESLLREAIKAGAAGYIVKRAAEDELINAIRAVSKGHMYLHPSITRLLVKDLLSTAEEHKDTHATLTQRELEVMQYIIRGFTNRQTAELLSISVRTVEGHRASLLRKLGLKNRVELLEYAESHGLVD
jgi:two-component system response regulator NreC